MQDSKLTYQVLARKYRPRSFEEMVGQEHVVLPLINAFSKQRLHHAYLFTGTRGVGKTSIARIIAKCLNCENGVTAKPCNQCSFCEEINQGNFVDLIEVDAASRTKVEDTRELLGNVQYVPTRGRYKIYLIDEVHMLSGHSFNALLKTLEEPPQHVKFLLATTDPQKLPATILSRCLQFHLKNLSPDCIANYLELVLKEEQIEFTREALAKIAQAADGSMRDALSLLDQAIAFGGGKVDLSEVSAMLGTVGQDYVESLLQALQQSNGKELLMITSKLAESAVDFTNVLEELISYLHRIAVVQVVSEVANNDAAVTKFCDLFAKKDIQLYYQIALIGRRDLHLAPNAQHGFEMILLRMLAFRPISNLNKSNFNKERQNLESANLQQNNNTITNREAHNINESPIDKSAPSILIDDWGDCLTKLQLSGMAYALAANCVLKYTDAEKIELILHKNHAALLNDKLRQRLNDAINQQFDSKVQLVIHVGETTSETPAERNIRQANEHRKEVVKSIKDDTNVKLMVEKLGVTVEPNFVEIE
jgi:DNA polymerase-3 subunit gamma/tau